jgi:2-polyprenyl-3-methyl-5-hydroxy-6-metoxy-1,4-benzoquinol methylase
LGSGFWKYRLKTFLKSFGLGSVFLGWGNKLWMLPKRFYVLARTVQNLMLRFEQLNKQVQELTQSMGRQHHLTISDITTVRENQNVITDKFKSLEKMLENNAVPTINSKVAIKEYRSIDYFSFEEKFRGSREVIKKRQCDYLGFIQDARKHTSAEFVDLGCGRGEFIELLTEHQIPISGVDLDAKNVVYCQSLGMHVECTDALNAMQNKVNNSLAGVVAFHMAEHLEPEYLNELIFTAFDKIKQGGCVIFETVNPNSFYSLSSFFLDLSHKKPLQPETLQYLMEQAGFKDTRFHFNCPVGDDQKLQGTDENTRKLNKMLFGYQGYAVIGFK